MEGATRLRQVAEELRSLLGGCSVTVLKHRVLEDTEYLHVAAVCPEAEIHVREYVRAGRTVRYSYQLVLGGTDVLRYDNAPHHPEVETFPHHVHRFGRVEPLYSPSLSAFLEEALGLIRGGTGEAGGRKKGREGPTG